MAYGRITRLPSGDDKFYQLRITTSPFVIYVPWGDFGSFQDRMKPGVLALGACWEVFYDSGDHSAIWTAVRPLPEGSEIFQGSGVSKLEARPMSQYFIGPRAWAETAFAEAFPEDMWNARELVEAFRQ